MKRNLLCLALFLFTAFSLSALEGVWGLRTELVQAFNGGTVLGFADPDSAVKISAISFLPGQKAELAYGRRVYETSWEQKGNRYEFQLSDELPPLSLTLIAAGEDTFRFSFCLENGEEHLRPAGEKAAFVNYIGRMKKLGGEG